MLICVYIGIKVDGVEILLCFFSAKFLLWAVAASIALQIMLHLFDITTRIFKTQPLDAFDMIFSLAIAIVPMLIVEGWKVVGRNH